MTVNRFIRSCDLTGIPMRTLQTMARRGAMWKHTRKLILKAAKKAGIVLPDNVGRHTFISMHVERYENANKTAKKANNSAEEIEESYRHLVSPEDAVKYWQIMPPSQPANVVAMAVAA